MYARGYTGHEHLDAFGLINMNGRLYDPALCMFISPDPFIQAPGFTQNYNRYAYCMFNPLMYTDPSGYTWKIFKPFLKGANWVWDNRKEIIKDIGIVVIVTVIVVGCTVGGVILGAALIPASVTEIAVAASFIKVGGFVGLTIGCLTWGATKEWIKDWNFWRDWESSTFAN